MHDDTLIAFHTTSHTDEYCRRITKNSTNSLIRKILLSPHYLIRSIAHFDRSSNVTDNSIHHSSKLVEGTYNVDLKLQCLPDQVFLRFVTPCSDFLELFTWCYRVIPPRDHSQLSMSYQIYMLFSQAPC